jgi:hypothetical protein
VKRARTAVGTAICLAVCAAAVPSTAAASGRCAADTSEATCDLLDHCYATGAIELTATPADAVSLYRSCLFTDHRFALTLTGTGVAVQPRPEPLPKIYESTFWPLYCSALERAAQRDQSICERRASASSTRGTSHRKTAKRTKHRRRTAPRFTG